MNSKKFFTTLMTAIALTIASPFAKAADPVIPSTHNPYTVLGIQLRSVLLADEHNGSSAVPLGPVIFQEIVPCRFISTLEADHYPAPWGGPAFQANESRAYRSTGELSNATWVNPCSQAVPEESLAIAARVWATGTKSTKSVGSTVVWLTPGRDAAPPDKLSKVALIPGEQSMNEATVVLNDHTFSVTTAQGGADLQIDIIGYFIKDTYGVGPKGDKGDRGPAGPAGADGQKGDVGPAGPAGADGKAGAQGEKGDKGDAGAIGAQGPKGDQGIQGAQGEKGDKGDKGDAGASGAQGPKGDQGIQGVQGEKGDKGDKGDQGERGERVRVRFPRKYPSG